MLRKLFDMWRQFVWWLTWPHSRGMVAFVLGLSLSLAACDATDERRAGPSVPSMLIAVVDVERVLRDAAPAQAAREHVAAAQKTLQTGWKKLQATYAESQQENREAVLAAGLQTLNKQLAHEEQAAKEVVLALMRDAVRVWRHNNGARCVMARSSMLDAAEANDITDAIMAMLEQAKPQFAALPTVQVREPSPGAQQTKPDTKQDNQDSNNR